VAKATVATAAAVAVEKFPQVVNYNNLHAAVAAAASIARL